MRGTRGDQAGTRVSKFAALEAMRNQSPSSPWATATSSASKCSTNGSAAEFIRRTWNYGSALGTAGAAPYRRVNPPPHGLPVSEFVYLRVRRARSSKAGLPPRTPRRMGCRHSQDRRAISVQLTPVTSGLSRSLADTRTHGSGYVEGWSRTDSQADSAGPIRSSSQAESSGRRHCYQSIRASRTGNYCLRPTAGCKTRRTLC